MSDVRLLDDNPARDDRLGFGQMKEVLYRIVRNPPDMPFTLGVSGTWGSGKTTLMRMIEDRLDQDRRENPAEGVRSVWFNAWKYDSKETIWNALIQTIFLKIREDAESRQDGADLTKRVTEAATALGIYAAKIGTRFIPGGIVREEDVDGFLAAMSSNATADEFAFINRFEDTFGQLVADYVGAGHLVVFVDDLDRCLPENAISVMEALKLYLDNSKCVFVIGAESGIIEQGIRNRYGENLRLAPEDYLDKVIQLPFNLPPADFSRAMGLLGAYADMPVFAAPEMRELMNAGTGGNPRRIKRFVNALWVLLQVEGDMPLDDQLVLAKILLLQMRFPTFFHRLLGDLDLGHRLSRALAAPDGEADKFRHGDRAVDEFFDDAHLAYFLRETGGISMKAGEITRFARLTSAHATTMPPGLIDAAGESQKA